MWENATVAHASEHRHIGFPANTNTIFTRIIWGIIASLIRPSHREQSLPGSFSPLALSLHPVLPPPALSLSIIPQYGTLASSKPLNPATAWPLIMWPFCDFNQGRNEIRKIGALAQSLWCHSLWVMCQYLPSGLSFAFRIINYNNHSIAPTLLKAVKLIWSHH